MNIEPKLEYNDGKGVIPEGQFRISPSGISGFFSDTHNWYRQNLMGEKGFIANEGSVTGTICHYLMECYTQDYKPNEQLIKDYIRKNWKHVAESSPNAIAHTVEANGSIMAKALLAHFRKCRLTSKIVEVEQFVWKELGKNVCVGGSIDLYIPPQATIIDYKSRSTPTEPKGFSKAYLFQQLIYAFLLRKAGKPVDFAELWCVNKPIMGRISEKTGKPLKDYPAKVTVLSHAVTEEDMYFIEDVLNLVRDSIDAWNKKPEMRYLLAQDYRLKSNSIIINEDKEF